MSTIEKGFRCEGGNDMICISCGKEIPDNYAFCSYCGTDLRMINKEPAAPVFPQGEMPAAPAFPVNEEPLGRPVNQTEKTVAETPLENAKDVSSEAAVEESVEAPAETSIETPAEMQVDTNVGVSDEDSKESVNDSLTEKTVNEEAPLEMPAAPAFPVDEEPLKAEFGTPEDAQASNGEQAQGNVSDSLDAQMPVDTHEDVPVQGGSVQSDIPVFREAEIPQNMEIDPEAGTTVLTAGMSGPLTSEMNAANTFAETPSYGGTQGVQGYNKVVTPAPVTKSTILSNEVVPPVTPTVQAQNYYGGTDPYGQASMNYGMNQYPANNAANSSFGNNDLITPWGYVGYSLLFAVPILGLIMMLVYGFGDGHSQNLKNYARGNLYIILIVIGIEIVVFLLMAILGVSILGALR